MVTLDYDLPFVGDTVVISGCSSCFLHRHFISPKRYSYRQELRSPNSPYLLRQGHRYSSCQLALYPLVDRSGSMKEIETEVHLALISLYLTATDLEVPTGGAFFGSHAGAFPPPGGQQRERLGE